MTCSVFRFLSIRTVPKPNKTNIVQYHAMPVVRQKRSWRRWWSVVGDNIIVGPMTSYDAWVWLWPAVAAGWMMAERCQAFGALSTPRWNPCSSYQRKFAHKKHPKWNFPPQTLTTSTAPSPFTVTIIHHHQQQHHHHRHDTTHNINIRPLLLL